jgi:glycolate oxidase
VVRAPSSDALNELQRLGLAIRLDPDVTASYSRDSTDLLTSGQPVAVVAPRNSDEVSMILSWASRHQVGVVTRGAATGISGGALAPDGCIVLTTENLTAVREIDPADRLATVEAGVLNGDLNREVANHGLMFAPDPSSSETCSVGGNVSTNAGGLRCIRYGATRVSVLGLEVVLPDGTQLRTGGRTTKRSTGYDLTQLFVGSEGTLGVVVAATVRLLPLPPPQLTALATFEGTEQAARAAAVLTHTGIPTLVELMDRAAVEAIDQLRGSGFGEAVGSLLLVQADNGPDIGVWFDKALGTGLDLFVTDDSVEAEYLVGLRRAAYPAAQQLGQVLVEDVAVPVSKLAALLERIRVIGSDLGTPIPTVAHAGDGNAHPLLIVGDGPEAEAQVWAAADAIFSAARSLGGTVSGEHGIGRLKKSWLEDEVGPAGIDLMRRIKQALDPLGIMNPGNLIP